MGVAEELDTLPAGVGRPLAELCRTLEKAHPHGMRDIAQTWRRAADNINNHAQGITGAVGGLTGAWEGASAEAFSAYCKGFIDVFHTMHDELQTAAAALEAAATAVDSAKSEIEKIGGDAFDHCRPYLVASPHDPPEAAAQRAAAMKSIVDNGVRDADPRLHEADKAVGEAAGKIGNAIDFMGPRQGTFSFNQLKQAADLPFTPAPGHRIDWVAKPAPAGPIGAEPAGHQPEAGRQPPAHQPAAAADGSGGDGSGGDSGSAVGSGSGPGGAAGQHHASSGGSGGHHSGGHHSGGASAGSGSGGYGSGGGGGGSDAPSGPPPPGNVQDWIKQAIEIMRQNGVPVSDADAQNIWNIIQHESGGNPTVINNWDSNAAAGHPSKGLMQCIDSTFDAHKLPGHNDIYNPVDNIIAGVRYSIDRYGSIGNVPGLQSMSRGGHYQGY